MIKWIQGTHNGLHDIPLVSFVRRTTKRFVLFVLLSIHVSCPGAIFDQDGGGVVDLWCVIMIRSVCFKHLSFQKK